MLSIIDVRDMCSGCFRTMPEEKMIPMIVFTQVNPVFYCKKCYDKEVKKYD
jgi:hypothetical protein